MSAMTGYVDIVFDGPPDPEAGRFVEVENADGSGVKLGNWVERGDGHWALRVTREDIEEVLGGAAGAITEAQRLQELLTAEPTGVEVEAAADAIYAELSGQYRDFRWPVDAARAALRRAAGVRR